MERWVFLTGFFYRLVEAVEKLRKTAKIFGIIVLLQRNADG